MSITMTTVILFAVFGVLLFLGVPISISIVASSIVTAMSTLSWDQITFITMQKMNSGVESFSLLAVPLFILAGNIMNNGGIAKRLVNFAQLFVGKIPGSMAQANILGNMLFGALSGSSVAAASAMGGCISPFNAWVLLQGTETLSLRVDRHVENTKKVVEFLAGDSHVAKVNHPSLPEHPDHELYQKYFPNGGASIFTFEIKGGQEAAWKFIDHLQVFSLLANVADVKSLVVHPATTTHSQLSAEELAEQNITPSTIRLSIGTENAEDIIWDLKQAFAALDE
jgi:hypothetical protein